MSVGGPGHAESPGEHRTDDGAPRTARPSRALSSGAQSLTALQRSAGNGAVTHLLGKVLSRQVAPSPPAPGPVVTPIAIAPSFTVEWTWVAKLGPLAHHRPRDENLMWAGDELGIFARISIPDARKHDIKGLHAASGLGGSFGDAEVSKAYWVNDSILGWNITASTPGRRSMSFEVYSNDGQQEHHHDIDFRVAADVTLFKARCSSAESVLNAKHAAGRKWFLECFKAYKAGYEAQDAAMEAQRGADRLAAQLLLGVMFAGVGGAVGGAVGQMTSVTEAAKVLNTEFNVMAGGALTDAAKDIGKFIARIPATVGGPGPIPGGGAGASTDPAAAAQAQGEGAPSGVDPLNWMATIDAKIAGERAAIGKRVSEAHLKADWMAVNNPDFVFDWDPVEVVNEGATIDGRPIDALGEVPTALQYERACWEVWLANYAFKLQYYSSDVPFGAGYEVESNVRKKLYERIDEVAKKFGESADIWIARYGAPSREKALAEKRKKDE